MANTIINLDNIVAQVDQRLQNAMIGAAREGVKVAKRWCPVRTGNLRASIQTKRIQPGRVTWGTDLYYAAPNERRRGFILRGQVAARNFLINNGYGR